MLGIQKFAGIEHDVMHPCRFPVDYNGRRAYGTTTRLLTGTTTI
jgi:hypothetical protein